MDELDRRIIRAVQDGLPLTPEPYRQVADTLGISADLLLERLRAMLDRGEVRRFGASVAHRNAGIAANVLCVWRIPPEALERFAREAGAFDAVTHCYDRPPLPDWPYNLYAMVHGRTEADVQAVIDELCRRTGQRDYVSLLSVREFKKTWTRI